MTLDQLQADLARADEDAVVDDASAEIAADAGARLLRALPLLLAVVRAADAMRWAVPHAAVNYDAARAALEGVSP